MRLRIGLLCLLLLGLCARAGAEPPPDPSRLAAAKAHYEHGEALYRQKDFAAAWLEFNTAYQLVPMPEFLFNMARCEAKTRRPDEALAHYRTYLAVRPDDPDAQAIRREIETLEAEVRATAAPPPARPVLPLYSLIGGTVSVVILTIGVAALGASVAQFNELAGRCAPSCLPEEVGPVRSLNASGFALLGIGLAGPLVSGVILPFELRWRRGHQRAALRLAPGGLGLMGRF